MAKSKIKQKYERIKKQMLKIGQKFVKLQSKCSHKNTTIAVKDPDWGSLVEHKCIDCGKVWISE